MEEADEDIDLGDIVLGDVIDAPMLQEDVGPEEYTSEPESEEEEEEIDDDNIEFGEIIDDGIQLGEIVDSQSPLHGGARTPRKIIGTKLRSPNYFQKRLHDKEPELFLTNGPGKV